MNQPKKGGRKGKYNSQVIDTICNTLLSTGSDSIACEAAGISRDTFYKWLSDADKKEFADKIADTRLQRCQETKQVVYSRKAAAEEYIDRVIKGQEFKITYRETLTRKDEIVTLTTREQVSPSEKMLERVLGTTESTTPFQIVFGLAEPEEDEVE